MTGKRHSTLLILLALLLGWQVFWSPILSVQSADPVVRAVLIYSPSCGHCELVITQVLPPLQEKYGDRLEILMVDINLPEGRRIYNNAVQEFQITAERIGVPTLILGETVLVGSREIPEQLPGMIENGLVQGGVTWPAVTGLEEILPPPITEVFTQPDENSRVAEPALASSERAATEPDPQPSGPADSGIVAKFKQDPTANTLAVIVLAGMLLSTGNIAYAFLASSTPRLPRFPAWFIPVVSILGLGVALYLSYVELYQADAICGPVGNCNAVQNSPYAYLFGIIPVGVVGALGYLAILAGWFVATRGPENLKASASLAMWGLAWIGIFFSIYLTFLEPFVIGATCMWCITSAILMTLVLWATTPAALQALQASQNDEEDEDEGPEPLPDD